MDQQQLNILSQLIDDTSVSSELKLKATNLKEQILTIIHENEHEVTENDHVSKINAVEKYFTIKNTLK